MTEKKLYKVIGLMSGTSLDGLDLVAADFELVDNQWTYKLVETSTVIYNKALENQLRHAINLGSGELSMLDEDYGQWLGRQVKRFVRDAKIKPELVASHGHTVFHEPAKGITLQIGHGQAIANETGLTTICDFRTEDVKLGGQGAPLVPIGDEYLFSEYLACLNLGGIANISYTLRGERLAFDVGMANMPLNYLLHQKGKKFDKDGQLARTGVVDKALFQQLNDLNYFQSSGPKSLGLEWFRDTFLPVLQSTDNTLENILATVVEHEAYQIGKAVDTITGQGELLITGGGAFNKYLVDRIKFYLPKQTVLHIPGKDLVEFKEALIFAFMGLLRLRNEINCLKSVTGASRDSSAGKIYYPRTN